MVWKAKLTTQTLRVGDTREITRFAWLPTQLGGDVVWLERYQVKQIYFLTEYADIHANKAYQVHEWKTIGMKAFVKEVEVVN